MSSFEMRYDFKAQQRLNRRINARANRKFSEQPSETPAELLNLFRERTKIRRACERDVLASYGGILPSSQNPILKLLVSKTPKARRGLLTGMNKAIVTPTPSKLLGLEDLYVVGNTDMRGFYRIDVDGVFESEEHLLAAVRACNAPVPNIVSWVPDRSGKIRNPHLIYVIRDSICFTEKGSQRAKQLYLAVERGLYARLLPVGADPGGMSNSLRFKNPVSPSATAIWPNDVAYQLSSNHKKARAGLLALADLVATDVPENAVWEKRAEQVVRHLKTTEGKETASNQLFRELREIAAHAVKKLRTVDGDVGTEDDLLAVLTGHITASYALPHKGPIRIAQSVARWFWANHDPLRAKEAHRPNRGLLKGTLEGQNLTARQRAGQAYVAQRRAETSEIRVRAAITALEARSEKATAIAIAIARECGVSVRTVHTVRAKWRKFALNNEIHSYPHCTQKPATWCMIKRETASECRVSIASDEKEISEPNTQTPPLNENIIPSNPEKPTDNPKTRVNGRFGKNLSGKERRALFGQWVKLGNAASYEAFILEEDKA